MVGAPLAAPSFHSLVRVRRDRGRDKRLLQTRCPKSLVGRRQKVCILSLNLLEFAVSDKSQ